MIHGTKQCWHTLLTTFPANTQGMFCIQVLKPHTASLVYYNIAFSVVCKLYTMQPSTAMILEKYNNCYYKKIFLVGLEHPNLEKPPQWSQQYGCDIQVEV